MSRIHADYHANDGFSDFFTATERRRADLRLAALPTDSTPVGLFFLLDFLTGSSVANISNRYNLPAKDIEDSIRTSLLLHGYSTADHTRTPKRSSGNAERLHVQLVERRAYSVPECRRLVAFMTVAEELHFGRAADRLSMRQSPLSRLIIGLENDIGARLFTRSRRYVRLTMAGLVFLNHASRIINNLESAAAETRNAHS